MRFEVYLGIGFLIFSLAVSVYLLLTDKEDD